MRRRPLRTGGSLLVAGALLTAALAAPPAGGAPGPAVAAAAAPAVTRCSAGLVSLTFDDGPDDELTEVLVDTLVRLRVPATFFVVGRRVDRSPDVVARVAAAGFAVANHSYAHERLPGLRPREVRRSLVQTRRSIRRAGVEPSALMRPPYGAHDARVDRVVADLGLVPVLWTVDPEDWKDKDAARIAERVLELLRPGKRNVVLQHDGITNSPASVAAVPRIVRRARAAGYCFAALDDAGDPATPVPALSVRNASAVEPASAGSLRFELTLDRPTIRATSVRVRTHDLSATAGRDYAAVDTRVRVPAGGTRAVLQVPVLPDDLDESRESLTLRLSAPRGLTLATRAARGTVSDDDPSPTVSVRGVAVEEPSEGSRPARVRLRLSAASGRPVLVHVVTAAGTAGHEDFTPVDGSVRFRPGQLVRRVPVLVHADAEVEPVEEFAVRIVVARRAVLGAAVGKVTVRPGPTPSPDDPAAAAQ